MSMLWDHWQEEVIVTSARGPWPDPEGVWRWLIYLGLLKEWVGDGEVDELDTQRGRRMIRQRNQTGKHILSGSSLTLMKRER